MKKVFFFIIVVLSCIQINAQTLEKKISLDTDLSLEKEPLIVIDRTPVYSFNDANKLLNNPEYIKSIEANKSGAGWGARGINGVILIKTMWGKDLILTYQSTDKYVFRNITKLFLK